MDTKTKAIIIFLVCLISISGASAYTDIALNKTTWAISTYETGSGAYTSNKTVDGTNSSWFPDNLGFPGQEGYVGVDLGAGVTGTLIHVILNVNAGFSTSAFINVSSDNTTFSNVFYNSALTGGNPEITVSWISIPRYINVSGSNAGTFGVREIYVYNYTTAPVLSPVSPGLYVILPSASSQTFTFTSSQGLTSYNWSVDDSAVVGTTSFTTSWDYGLHHVRVYGINATTGASNTIEWRASVNRELAASAIQSLNNTQFLVVKNAARSADLEALLTGSISPYTTVLTVPIFWMLCWVMILAAFWIRQRQATSSIVIAMIFGTVIIGSLPDEYQPYARGIVAIVGFAVVYILVSERR